MRASFQMVIFKNGEERFTPGKITAFREAIISVILLANLAGNYKTQFISKVPPPFRR